MTGTPAAAASVPARPPAARPRLWPACRPDSSGRPARRSSSTPCAFIATSTTLLASVIAASAAARVATPSASETTTSPSGYATKLTRSAARLPVRATSAPPAGSPAIAPASRPRIASARAGAPPARGRPGDRARLEAEDREREGTVAQVQQLLDRGQPRRPGGEHGAGEEEDDRRRDAGVAVGAAHAGTYARKRYDGSSG